MSVLACDRRDCENIMCDRFSYIHGYICNDCFKELVSTGPMTNIGDFMETPKNPNHDTDEAYARYDFVFSLRD